MTNLLPSMFWFQLSSRLCSPYEPMHELHRIAPHIMRVAAIFTFGFFIISMFWFIGCFIYFFRLSTMAVRAGT